MSTSNILDNMYRNAASFGRDVFHYAVSGTTFTVVCSVPFWSEMHEFLQSGNESIYKDAGFQLGFLLVAAIVLFGLGHVLVATSFCIARVEMFLWPLPTR